LQASSGQTITFAAHEQPIRAIRFVDVPGVSPAPMIATGSWDKTVRYFDLRNTQQPVATVTFAERVYSMDTARSLLVVATADCKNHLINLSGNPAAIVRSEPSPLKFQTRVVCAAADGSRWATGSIEGRTGVSLVDEKEKR
jgi:mRNA export factor